MKDKKDIRSMFKDTAIMFAITILAGLILGFVYEITKEPIILQKEKKISKACQEVFKDATTFESIEVGGANVQQELAAEGVTITKVFVAYGEENESLGYVISVVSSEGYAGNIGIFMGVRNDGTLNGISILEIGETPGLGMEAKNVLVPQFAGKNVSAFTYTKTGATVDSQIDAISAATITTKAVTSAVNGGLKFFDTQLKKGGTTNE